MYFRFFIASNGEEVGGDNRDSALHSFSHVAERNCHCTVRADPKRFYALCVRAGS